MLFFQYLILNNRVFFFFYFKKNLISSFLLLRKMCIKYSFNWLNFSLFFKEFFYDCGFLKWNKKY